MPKRHSSNFTAAIAIATTMILGAATQAHAQDRIHEGRYVIEVHDRPDPSAYARYAGCMIISNNGHDTVPSLYDWHRDGGTWCGLYESADDMVVNRQAVWEVYTVTSTHGQEAYVIKSLVNGRCLIRGQNGHAAQPSLHVWTAVPGGDARFCGLRSADELILNGQAAWTFDALDASPDAAAVLGARTGGPTGGVLAFTKSPSAYPNPVNRDTFASFTSEPNRWAFVFWRM